MVKKSATPQQDLAPKEVIEWANKNVVAFRDALAKGILTPLNLVMLTRERIQEVTDDAVSRGRMTRRDAEEFVQNLLRRGRRETDDVLSDLERLLGHGRVDFDEVTSAARRRATDAATSARQRIERSSTKPTAARKGRTKSPAAKAARARQAAATGTRLPIASYDELTATQVQQRLKRLTKAEARRINEYERRHANRKTLLTALESKLG